jgi:hypothetical protein
MAITTILSKLRIPQRLRSLVSSAQLEQKLERLKMVAQIDHRALSSGLTGLGGYTPLHRLVRFYSAVSPWCDRSTELYELERKLARIDSGQYTKAREALLALAAQDERYPYGPNQTSTGETPTVDTTFLGGDRCGLPTKTVAKWEAIRAEYTTQPAIIGEPHPTVMEVIDARASELMNDGLERWESLLQDLINS